MTKCKLSKEERVLAGLAACGDGTWEKCQSCPYQGLDSKFDECWEKLCKDAIVLLKQQASCVRILNRDPDESALIHGNLTDKVKSARGEAVESFKEHLKQNYSEICVFVKKSGEEEVKWLKYSPALLDELANEFLERGGNGTDGGGNPSGKGYFSAEEVRCMTLDEVAANREAIVQSMKNWHG